MKYGFDNEKYVKIQSEKIKERVEMFDKLYLEIGGKLFDDSHASRVLPGFKSDAKISMLQELKDELEIIFCINASDIEKAKVRQEHGSFIKKLERHEIKTYIHRFTKGYPLDVDTIVSEEGYGANPYIETTKKIVLVNAPGPGSGKLATCLSQIYHEHKRGINAGYAKFETFPVWNLALKHPVNMAYEAATADLKDVNMIDSFHLSYYNEPAVNYNRDIEMFPVVKSIMQKIMGKSPYNSPTDMGVNMVGNCIIDTNIVEDAAKREIVRRYFQEMNNYKMGVVDFEVPEKIKILMNELEINEDIIIPRGAALEKSHQEKLPCIAMDIDGTIITGKESNLLSAPSALIINAIKYLSNIPDNIDLLSPTILEPILNLRTNKKRVPLQLQEVLIALSICSVTNPTVGDALKQLEKLKDKDAHSSYIITNGELKKLKELKIRLTCEPNFYSNNLFLD